MSLEHLQPRNIALIKPSALGDIVHALPVLHAIRTRFPTARITWVVNQSYASLLAGHPDLNDVLAFDRSTKRGWSKAVGSAVDLFRQLRSAQFDLVLDLQGLLRSGLMTLATRASHRVGLSSAREGARLCYTNVIPSPALSAQHAVDRNWLFAQALGVDEPKQFIVARNHHADDWANEVLSTWPRPWIIIGPGARWQTKRWLPGHFAALAKSALHRFGGSVILVGAKDESAVVQEVAESLGQPTLNLCGTTTLPQLAALLRRADVMIANDSGPLHLAAALGRPVVAPYTCTRVARHGPYGMEHGTVETTVACRGSYVRTCSNMICMNELTADRLTAPLHEALTQWSKRRTA